MKKIIRAEMWDKMQYLFRNYYDRMMHCVLYYNSVIDETLFAKALKFQVDRVPVLHSRYHNNFIKPYWVEQDYDISEVLTVKHGADMQRDVMEFVTQRIPITKRVQLQIGLFENGGKTAFVMVSNHMCFDGGDFKYFVIKLCENYSKLASGDDSLDIKTGSRSYKEIYSSLSEEDKKIAKGLYKNVSAVKDKHYFPLTPKSDEDVNRIIMHKIPAERFTKLRVAGKGFGFTVNDVIIAVYIRSICEFAGFSEDEAVTIPCMVDLRRHLKQRGLETGLTNHTGFMPVTVRGIGKDMRETLSKVGESMEANKKDRFLGLYSLPLLSLAYTIFPHFISEPAIKIGYDNPLIGMSNIGSIVPSEYSLDGMLPYDGFYTGAVKSKPFMQLALTTFEGEATFTIAICGNSKDEEIVGKFFEIFEKNVDEVIKLGK